MEQPKFYVGQSVVVGSGDKGEMYAISHASFESGKWTYYAVQGSDVRYLHDFQIVFYHHDGEWHKHTGGTPPVAEVEFV